MLAQDAIQAALSDYKKKQSKETEEGQKNENDGKKEE